MCGFQSSCKKTGGKAEEKDITAARRPRDAAFSGRLKSDFKNETQRRGMPLRCVSDGFLLYVVGVGTTAEAVWNV